MKKGQNYTSCYYEVYLVTSHFSEGRSHHQLVTSLIREIDAINHQHWVCDGVGTSGVFAGSTDDVYVVGGAIAVHLLPSDRGNLDCAGDNGGKADSASISHDGISADRYTWKFWQKNVLNVIYEVITVIQYICFNVMIK